MPMRLFVIFSCFIATLAMAEEEALSCPALIDAIKESNCIKPVAPFLDGAYVKVGAAIQGLNMTIESEDADVKAAMVSEGSLSPYYAIGFKDRFFGNSGFGYAYGLTYVDAYALQQGITRGDTTKNVDLSTYVTTSMYAVQPTLFYAFGARNSTPETHTKLGIGLTVGYTSIKGTSYLTEDEDSVSAACWTAGNDLVSGATTNVNNLKTECETESYQDSGIGLGGRLFFSTRWKNIMLDFNAANMIIRSSDYNLNPLKVNLTLSYVLNV